MAAVAPGDVLSALNPVLDAFTASAGTLADPYALAWQVFDVRDENVPPVQLFPSTPGQRQAVDLVADRIGLGHFAVAWTVPSNAPAGRYQMRWYLTQNQGDAERAWRRDFEVVPQVFEVASEPYALIADVRDEGVGPEVKNRRIAEALDTASKLVELWTGRTFRPAYKAAQLDGPASTIVLFDEPICALESLTWTRDGSPIDPTSIVVYARHLTENLRSPDDRDSPKVQFVRYDVRGILTDIFPLYPLIGSWDDLRAPRITHAQELTAKGVFGYTDFEPNGCPVGSTPNNIRRATVLIALRDLPKQVSQPDLAFDARYGHRIKSQRTREQAIEWNPRLASDQIAPYTGDPAIDSILLTYQKPLSGGAV